MNPVDNAYGDYYERQVDPNPQGMTVPGRAIHGGTPAALGFLILGVLGLLVAIRLGFRGFVIEL
ncbi:MAG TPA: hypothetical protein VFC99_05735 [Acidimicrobiia bacterium]|nr:hypothetical protein [Acidimicrobiia bacterium]